jgi:hypothetical protein
MTRNPPMALPLPTHIPTVLHLAPQTLSSAARAARIAGRPFERWLTEAVELSASLVDGEADAPWDEPSMHLFARVASAAPGLLEGRWRSLYDRVATDPDLWRPQTATLAEIEEGLVPFEPPVIDEAALARRWPALVAEAFCRR